MRDALRKAEDALVRAEGAALAALLAAMVALAFAQVVLRLLDAGLLWADTLLKHLVVWTGFLGAALAAAAEKHFCWEAGQIGAPEGLKPWLRLGSSLAAAAVCALLLRAAAAYVADARATGEILATIGRVRVPAWAAFCGIPGGFALVLLHLLFKAADAAAELGAR